MSYTANVPVSGQSLGNSRPIINANFAKIQSVFDANHVDFNLSNAGMHTHVDLLTQASDPNPAATIVSHYSKSVAGNTEWFFQRENSGPVIQMSNLAGIPTVLGATGRTFLPGGLILLWGLCNYQFNATSSGQAFQGGGFPNNGLTMMITPFSDVTSGGVSLSVSITSKTVFSVTAKTNTGSGSATPGAYYWAIGN